MANIKHTIFGSLWCPITLMCVLAAHIDDLIIPVLMGATDSQRICADLKFFHRVYTVSIPINQ